MSIIEFTKRIIQLQRIRFFLAVGILVAASFFEGFGLVLLLPLLRMIMEPASAAADSVGRLGSSVKDIFSILHIPFSIGPILVLIVLMVAIQQVLLLAQQKVVFGSQFKFESHLRDRLYRAVFGARWPFFVQTKHGDLANALSVEISRGGQAYNVLNLVISGLLVSAVYLLLALALSWQATMFVTIVGAFVMLGFKRETGKGRELGVAITEANQGLQDEALEQLSAAKLIKGYAAQEAVIDRFRRRYSTLARALFLGQFNNARIKAFLEAALGLLLALTIYVAVVIFNFDLASLVVFLFIFYRVGPRITSVQTGAHKLNTLLPSLDRVDRLTANAVAMEEETGRRSLKSFTGKIVFEGVDFAYVPESPVLTGLSLSIPKGQTIGIVGSSGAGKSTVVDLLIGLIRPDFGQVLVDGVSLTEYDLADWKHKLGYVAQDTVLFNDTVTANIAWAAPGADKAKVEAAAKLAHAHQFVQELSDGYDTVIGARGVKLSGGQRQRLAMARAIIREPELLILDEATSALDAESERNIQQAVETLAKKTTIVIVTHRLATLKNADYIYVLEDQRVVEEGTWEALASGQGRFDQLKRLQALD